MPTYEVDLTLCRTVTVTVEAKNERDAKEAALCRAKWLTVAGLRSRLRLLCSEARELPRAS